MNNFDKIIQMYIFEGNPNGRIMCELSNWNGRVYKVSRNDLSEFSQRNDAENTGIYFLFGKDEDSFNVYIGEAERILSRLKQHLKDDVYWNECVIVISKDNLLNKAHVKFLENQFYKLAIDSNRYRVLNSTIPNCPSLSEYDIVMLQEFISNAKMLINSLGYKVFETIEDVSLSENNNQYFFINAARGANATGVLVSDGFAVLKGSYVADSVTKSIDKSLIKLRQSLYDNGTINDKNCFAKDYVFTSPSLAASIVMGRNANGRTEWKNNERQSLKEFDSLT